MNSEIVSTPNDRNATFAIAGGNNPSSTFPKIGTLKGINELVTISHDRLDVDKFFLEHYWHNSGYRLQC